MVLGKIVSFWHTGEGSDYSVVSLRQECHDTSVLHLVKPVSSPHPSFRREESEGNGEWGGPPCAISGQAFSTVPECSSTNTHLVNLRDFSSARPQTGRLAIGCWRRWGARLVCIQRRKSPEGGPAGSWHSALAPRTAWGFKELHQGRTWHQDYRTSLSQLVC